MPERFDDIVHAVLTAGTETHHEVKPADFGDFRGRRNMFIRCLEMVAIRFPDIRIAISGQREALIDMGLLPGGEALIGKQVYRTQVGPITTPGTIRLTFSRR